MLTKLAVKVPAAWSGNDDVFIGVFQSWIQENTISGLLLDVADYRHVPNGPSVMLIGHAFDIVMDRAEGGFGIMVVWKHDLEAADDTQAVVQVLDKVLETVKAFQGADLGGDSLTVDLTKVRVLANDRLGWPNDADHLATLQAAAEAAIGIRYGEAALESSQVDPDQRQRLGIDIAYAGSAPAL